MSNYFSTLIHVAYAKPPFSQAAKHSPLGTFLLVMFEAMTMFQLIQIEPMLSVLTTEIFF